jgi:hypothetical protein
MVVLPRALNARQKLFNDAGTIHLPRINLGLFSVRDLPLLAANLDSVRTTICSPNIREPPTSHQAETRDTNLIPPTNEMAEKHKPSYVGFTS